MRAIEEHAETLAAALVAQAVGTWIELPGLGRITTEIQRAHADQPERRLPFFVVAEEFARSLVAAAAGDPAAEAERSKTGDSGAHTSLGAATPGVTPAWAAPLAAAIREALLREERAEVAGCGVFEITSKPARQLTNPQTGAHVTTPPRRLLRFHADGTLVERLNRR